jgi:hypothetical protein
MRKLLALLILCVFLIGTTIGPTEPLHSFFDKMTCVEVIELYSEAGALHQVSGERMNTVKSKEAKFFWSQIRQFTLSLHPPLLQARGQKCKAA